MRKTALLTAALAAAQIAALSLSAAADAGFAGNWKVTDTNGKPFTIMLSEDGKARADRSGEAMKGAWKTDGDAAVITWDTGWVTKIMKDGDGYKKVAFDKGAAPDGKPTNSSKAERVGK
ncbi:MAG: hypothetical protein AB7L18_10260 [Hyphomicrobiaceae bacterium]